MLIDNLFGRRSKQYKMHSVSVTEIVNFDDGLSKFNVPWELLFTACEFTSKSREIEAKSVLYMALAESVYPIIGEMTFYEGLLSGHFRHDILFCGKLSLLNLR